MEKPHRVLADRVAGYADDAAAYLRRRRTKRSPFARVWWAEERAEGFDAHTEQGRELFSAAARLIDAARR